MSVEEFILKVSEYLSENVKVWRMKVSLPKYIVLWPQVDL